MLNHLAHFVETRQANAQKLQLALLYPALLATVSIGIMVLLMIYVVPDIVRVFVSRGADLPFLTRALIALSAFLQNWGLATAAGDRWSAASLFGRWARVPANRLRLDRMFAERRPFTPLQPPAQRRALRRQPRDAGRKRGAAGRGAPRRRRGDAQPLGPRPRAGRRGARARRAEPARRDDRGGGVPDDADRDRRQRAKARASSPPRSAARRDELERELDALVATLVALVEPMVLLMMGGLVLMMVLAILLPIINLNNLVTL